jgi:hypothetical protein
MSQIAYDHFTDTDGTNLTAHTSDSGHTWACYVGVMQIQGNQAAWVSGLPYYLVGSVQSSPNYSVSAKIVTKDNFSKIIGRAGTDGSNPTCYALSIYNNYPEVYRLTKWVAGTPTVLGTGTHAAAAGDVVTLKMDGDQISVLVNGTTEIAAVTDSGVSSAGRAGIWASHEYATFTLDDFSVDSLDSATAPTVTASAPSDVTSTTATGNGDVTSDGGDTVTDRGICWGASADPDLAGSHAHAAAGGTGAFTVAMTGLTPGATYHYRTFATNGEGTGYSADGTFTTFPVGIAWGEQTPTDEETPLAWTLWKDGADGAVTVVGDASWGQLEVVTGTAVYGSVIDIGSTALKTFSVTRDKYGTGSGNVAISIRGSDTSFAQLDVSPSWAAYSAPTQQTWQYVQLKLEFAA